MRIHDMIEFVKLNAAIDFNICTEDVEIIESAKTEYGSPIEILNDDETIFHRFGNADIISFYIKSRHQRLVNIRDIHN